MLLCLGLLLCADYGQVKKVAYRLVNGLSDRSWATLGIVLLVACLASSGTAQDSADVHIVPRAASPPSGATGSHSADDRAAPALSLQVDLVLVPVTVTDGMNRPVIGLRKNDFSVYEDDAGQSIRYFSAEDTPISFGILFDLSGTMAHKIDAAREALSEFFNNANPEDDYFVITFSDRPQLIADSTGSPEEVQRRLGAAVPSGHTALLDAIDMGVAKLRNAAHHRRALLIISDGGDNWSRHHLREVETEVEESGVEVYAIGLFNDGVPVLSVLDEKFGKRLLSKVAEASGGRMVTVDSLTKLPEIAANISREMRSQYVLGYHSTNAVRDGKWRKIRVRVGGSALTSTYSARLSTAYKRGYIGPLR